MRLTKISLIHSLFDLEKKVYTSSSENLTNHKSYFHTYVMSVIK